MLSSQPIHVLSKARLLGLALLASVLAAAGCGSDDAPASPSPTAATEGSAKRSIKDLERIVRERVEAEGSTGIVAGMVFPGGETRVVAAGRSERRKLDERSVFEIGSVTKVFTGTLLSEMTLRGEVELSDPVADLLPPDVSVPEFEGNPITLEDLATHTSGLPSLPTNFRPEDPDNPYAGYGVEQLFEFLNDYELTRSPGSQYEYSNIGVGLLGQALARRAGTTYEALVRERILAPLGMDETAIELRPSLDRRFVNGHDTDGRVVPAWDLPTLAGAGALRSSMTDMLEFASANLEDGEGTLANAMAAAHEPRISADAETRVGLNWHVQDSGEREIVWHNGGTAGFASFIGLDLERDAAIVVLSNSQQSIDDIGFHALDETVPLTEQPATIDLRRKVLDRYVGTYDLAGARVRLTISRGGLSAKVPGERTWRLYAETPRRFFLKAIPAKVTFKVNPNGRVEGFELIESGEATAATKVG